MADEKDLNAGWRTTKSIPEDATEFEANGRRYRVSRSISFDRYEAYEMLQVEIGMARTFEQFTAQVQEAYDLCNAVATGKPVFADLAVLLRDMRIGTTLIGERQTPAILKLCALFINREGEDVRVVDDQVIEDKINDWRQEGLDMRFFFALALRSIPGFSAALRAASRDTSQEGDPPRPSGSTSKPESSRSGT
jgi:hypothetical protein